MFRLAYIGQELRRRRGRALLTALGLGLGIALVVAVTSLSTGLDRAQDRAADAGVEGRSKMSKDELVEALNS